MKKTIIVDCDGVVLNWEYAFDIFMEEHGFTQVADANVIYNIGERYGIDKAQGKKLIKMFNESAAIGFLPPLRDAVEVVTRMADEGWRFIAVTSLSTNKYAQKLRKRNLDKLFGKGTFITVTCLATGADKDDALAKYAGSGMYWVEDKPENALAGQKQGLKPILVEHGFNMDNTDFPLAKNWKEIYEIVSG
jgi:phosphoglycolate phosphatase-like HAD superfamily hydrolase